MGLEVVESWDQGVARKKLCCSCNTHKGVAALPDELVQDQVIAGPVKFDELFGVWRLLNPGIKGLPVELDEVPFGVWRLLNPRIHGVARKT